MTDGRRNYITQTIPSFLAAVKDPELITSMVIHEDGSVPGYTRFLQEEYGHQFEIISGGDRLGHGGAVRRAWFELNHDPNRFIFHLEDDFIFEQQFELAELADLLDDKYWLAQVSLRRDRWGREQVGFIEDAPGWYSQKETPRRKWIETRRNWSFNPCMYRSKLLSVGYPEGLQGEVEWTTKLLATGLPWNVQPGMVQFGIWGGLDEPPYVTHIGFERVGHGY